MIVAMRCVSVTICTPWRPLHFRMLLQAWSHQVYNEATIPIFFRSFQILKPIILPYTCYPTTDTINMIKLLWPWKWFWKSIDKLAICLGIRNYFFSVSIKIIMPRGVMKTLHNPGLITSFLCVCLTIILDTGIFKDRSCFHITMTYSAEIEWWAPKFSSTSDTRMRSSSSWKIQILQLSLSWSFFREIMA